METDYNLIREKARESELQSRRRENLKYLLISIVVVLLVLVIWQLAVENKWVSTRFFDSPIGV